MDKQRILVVDDVKSNRLILKAILESKYSICEAENGQEALDVAKAEPRPSLILLDVKMPGMDGFEVCRLLKENYLTRHIPVIFVTALGEVDDEAHGFEVGAVDYITKPVNEAVVQARVKTHLALFDQTQELMRLVEERTQEIKETQIAVIERLGRAAEYKDNETGKHVIRMSLYARILAVAVGMTERDAEILKLAAPMHDIGKIKIPDDILKRKGKLSPVEMDLMRGHAQFGAEIIGEHHSELLKMARTVALSHHEKWDGTGYPYGLKGEEIPLISRIVAIADVFDALTSKRPYKEPWSVESALAYIEERGGDHFDPSLVSLLRKNLPSVLEIYHAHSDNGYEPIAPEEMDEQAISVRR